MSKIRTGLSYLDRPLFSLSKESLSAWTFWILGLLIISGIGLIYLLLAAAYLLIAYDPMSGAPSAPDKPAVSSPANIEDSVDSDTDALGSRDITFTRGMQNHYFRENQNAGPILIITGTVRNSYPEARSFIRLKSSLLSAGGKVLSERSIYAGNVINENDLTTLPMPTIEKRLAAKEGQKNQNINIAPGDETPFMFVFDKLPDGMSEYRIDPISSSPAQ